MAQHLATIEWQLKDGDFSTGRYSRAHTWRFDGGQSVLASASPHIVPLPWSDPQGVDPEEVLIAALSSCHMLSFLWLAAKAGFVALAYSDQATGVLSPNTRGALWLSRVTLQPQVQWQAGNTPDEATELALHHQAHDECFIAQSVKTEVVCEPLYQR